jgi:hypothetical protein
VLSPELKALLSRIDRVQMLVWTVLTLSIVLYGAVAFAVAGSREGSELGATLRPLFYLAGLCAAGLSWVLHRRARSAALPRGTAPASDPPAGSRDALLRGNPEVLAQFERLPERERRALTTAVRGFTPWMLCLVLNEAVAILGLVLALLAGTSADVIPFTLAALILNAAMRPDNRGAVERALGQVGI